MPIIINPTTSFSITAIDLISESYRIAGVLGNDETPDSWQAQQGLTCLNDMLDIYSIDRSMIYTIKKNSFPLVSGTASYTIGDGGDFDIDRPPTIDFAFVRLNSVDFPLKQINNQDYDSLAVKSSNNFPMYYYYDAGFPLGTIFIYGVPNQPMDIFLDTWSPLTKFDSITDTLGFPAGYAVMMKYNLAKFLAGRNGLQLLPSDEQLAIDTMALVKDRNLPDYVMKTEVGYLSGDQNYFGYRGY
jgi:hypothetical protein